MSGVRAREGGSVAMELFGAPSPKRTPSDDVPPVAIACATTTAAFAFGTTTAAAADVAFALRTTTATAFAFGTSAADVAAAFKNPGENSIFFPSPDRDLHD